MSRGLRFGDMSFSREWPYHNNKIRNRFFIHLSSIPVFEKEHVLGKKKKLFLQKLKKKNILILEMVFSSGLVYSNLSFQIKKKFSQNHLNKYLIIICKESQL